MAGYFRIKGLRRDFAPSDPQTPAAIEIAALNIELGGIVAVIGGSGSGKTTLLNLLGGLEPPDEISNVESDLKLRLPDQSMEIDLLTDPFPHNRVSYVFQQGYLLNQASLRLNLAMTRRAAGLPADESSLRKLLEVAQLNSGESKTAHKDLSDRAITLSGGQQQRVNIARALGREPALIFADELTSSLDPEKARDVLTNLRAWIWEGGDLYNQNRRELKRSMIWVTHDYSLAAEFSDAILVMGNGKPVPGCERQIELNTTAQMPSENDLLDWVQNTCIPETWVIESENKKAMDSHHTEAEEERKSLHAKLSASTSFEPNANATGNKGEKAKQLSKKQVAIGNLLAGIKLSFMDSFPPVQPAKSKILTGFKYLVRPLLGYSNWVRALQLAAVLGLVMLVTYGQQEVIAYFDRQLEDPSLRHVIVSQNMREPDLSIVNDDSLTDLEESVHQLNPLASTAESAAPRAAFGRFTEYLSSYPEGEDDIGDGFVAEVSIGVIDSQEPAYATLPVTVIDEDNPSCDSDITALAGQLIPYDDELVVILSERYLKDIDRMFDVDLCEHPYLDFWDKDTRTFRVVGYVDELPADGFDNFDGVIQTDVWRTWYSGMNKRQINNLSRAAVYFDRRNHEGVIDELFDRSFAFNQEIVGKFRRLMSTAAQLRNTFSVISWLSLFVAITVAAGLIWSYLLNNAKSIAVLRAHDAWFWPLVSAIPFQLILAYIYALLYLALVAVVWNMLIAIPFIADGLTALSGGDWVPKQLRIGSLANVWRWLFLSLGLMVLVGWICLGLWRVSRRRLAHELREAY